MTEIHIEEFKTNNAIICRQITIHESNTGPEQDIVRLDFHEICINLS